MASPWCRWVAPTSSPPLLQLLQADSVGVRGPQRAQRSCRGCCQLSRSSSYQVSWAQWPLGPRHGWRVLDQPLRLLCHGAGAPAQQVWSWFHMKSVCWPINWSLSIASRLVPGLTLTMLLRQRPKISREMIGQPTNFRHTSHVGSSDIGWDSSF